MRNQWLTLIMLLLLISNFVGCKNDVRKMGQPIDIDEQQIDLRIVTMFGGTDPSKDTFEQQLDAFEKKHPHIKITNESSASIGDEFRTAVKTDFLTDNEPDILFFYSGVDVTAMIEAGSVMSYEEVWKTYPEVGGDIKSAIFDLVRESDGQVYALPLTGFYEGLYINKEIFKKYNLELPSNWDQFIKAIKVLRNHNITPIAAPLAQSHYLVEHFIYAQAGIDAYKDTLAGDIPEVWIKGLNTIKELFDMGAFPKNTLALEIESAQTMFKQEKAAMIFEGSWFVGQCSDVLKDKMTIIPMPTPPGGAKGSSDIIAGFSTGYYISRKAYEDKRKQEAVVDLVAYLTTAKAIKAIAIANDGIPSTSVQMEGLHRVEVEGREMFLNAKERALPIDSRLTPEAFNYILLEGVPYIVFGERDAGDVLLKVKEINDY